MPESKRIKKLNPELINQIAAGEVVERPASVVKELIENSVDAEAKNIIIELEKGGKDLIRVIDDGDGLDRAEFDLVFERHATSKIESMSDLQSNEFLGFRGEALATIASVSEIEFASNGYAVKGSGAISPKSMPNGTQVTVQSLFYNVPAREKFLKTDGTEYKQCLAIIEEYVLAQPEISFKLYHNGKEVFNYPAVSNSEKQKRIEQLLGREFSEKLLEANFLGEGMQITGYIGKPELAKDKPYNQFFFINGRPIQAPYFNHAIKNAFGSVIFPSEKPPFIFWLTLKPQDVDMNVHPRKLEARFHFQSMIYSNLMRATKKALESNILRPTLELSRPSLESFIGAKSIEQRAPSTQPSVPSPQPSAPSPQPSAPSSQPSALSSFNKYYSSDRTTKLETTAEIPQTRLRPIHQIALSYIMCESPEGLVIIDQHAAHERVMYEQLKEVARSKQAQSQKLLIPTQIELSNSEMATLEAAQEVLSSIGFEITNFGGQTIAVQAIPAKFSKESTDELVRGLLSDLSEGIDFSNLEKLEDEVLHYAACRGAIKFGQSLSHLEQVALIQEMEKIEGREYSCPHGRPTMITISFDELEKEFKRRK